MKKKNSKYLRVTNKLLNIHLGSSNQIEVLVCLPWHSDVNN